MAFSYICLHHSVTPVGSGYLLAKQKKYHLVIDFINGKYRFIQSVPDDQVATFATGCFNSKAYAICVVGNYDLQPVTGDLLGAIVQAVLIKSRKLTGKQQLTTHNEVGLALAPCKYVTACPGKNLRQCLPIIRDEILKRGGLS